MGDGWMRRQPAIRLILLLCDRHMINVFQDKLAIKTVQ
jgi:hypothetical protein